MEVNIEYLKNEIIQWLKTLEDATILVKINKIRTQSEIDWWIDIPEQERKSIEKGIKDADNGNLVTNKEVMKIFNK